MVDMQAHIILVRAVDIHVIYFKSIIDNLLRGIKQCTNEEYQAMRQIHIYNVIGIKCIIIGLHVLGSLDIVSNI